MSQRKILHDLLEINRYPKQIYIEIFNILSKKTQKYTSNSNGIFFNLREVDDDSIEKVLNILNNITDNLKQYNKFLVEDRKEKIEIFKNGLQEETKVKKNIKEKIYKLDKKIKNPFTDIEYKGVYKRLDAVLKNKKRIPNEDQVEIEEQNIETSNIDDIEKIQDDEIEELSEPESESSIF